MQKAIDLHGSGRLPEAIQQYEMVIAAEPENAVAHSNMAAAHLALGRIDAAITGFKNAITIKPDDFEAFSNLGVALKKMEKPEQAVICYQQAIAINPGYAEAHHNLGCAFKSLDRLDEAVASFRQALAARPGYAESCYNIANILQEQGQTKAAIRTLQHAIEMNPDNSTLLENLINQLNYYIPDVEENEKHAAAQLELHRVPMPLNGAENVIEDHMVKELFLTLHGILSRHDMAEAKYHKTQIFRGVATDTWPGATHGDCTRHEMAFKKFRVIPEYCFDCYKITVEPETVVDLIKLTLLFTTMDLPDNNTRKCIVEMREVIAGTYKGFIYARSHAEAKKVFELVEKEIHKKISSTARIFIKRGCSEYPLVYPEYAEIGEDGATKMDYRETWRPYEEYVDARMAKEINYPRLQSHDHPGFTLRDALVMRNWLSYAAQNGDASYRIVHDAPLPPLPMPARSND